MGNVTETTRKGRPPALESNDKRQREIAALEQAVAAQKKRLEELKGAQYRAQKAARRAYLNQCKYSVGGLAQIADLLEVDHGFLLGALFSIDDLRESDGTWPSSVFQRFKARGDEALSNRANARRAHKHSADGDEAPLVGAVAADSHDATRRLSGAL